MQHLKSPSTIFSLLVTTILVSNLVWGFTEPSSSPPLGNVPAPLNVSSSGQSKAGGLILNTGGASYGLIVDQGNVGIGTQSPTQKLDVAGYIRGATGLCIGSDCRTGWPGVGLVPFSNVQVFTSNGAFTVPVGVTKLWVEVYGGGGGGGYGGGYDGAGGGGAGGVVMGFVTVAPGQNINVIIGGGGQGGRSGSRDGDNGGMSSFATLSANGGTGGLGTGRGGKGGEGSGGLINQTGGGGSGGSAGNGGGNGGSNTRGGGGYGGGWVSQDGAGGNGGIFGGGGGATGGGGGNFSGGSGGSGGIAIWW